MLKEEQKFDVTGFKFEFRLDEYTCYLRRKGKCSLDFPFNNHSGNNKLVSHDEGSFDYCRDLYLYMKENPIDNITIAEFCCGHYSFTDGQHRACIAKRKHILIPIEFHEKVSFSCSHCYYKKKSLKYRIEAFLCKTKEFTDDEKTKFTLKNSLAKFFK